MVIGGSILLQKALKTLCSIGYADRDHVLGEDIIEISAPNILSLTIEIDLMLWKLWKLRKLLLLNMSSLVEATLDFTDGVRWRTCKSAEEEILKGLIPNLFHTKELKIVGSCHEVVSGLEAEGFVFPSNVKFVERSSWFDSDSVESKDL